MTTVTKSPSGNANTVVSGITSFVLPFVLPYLYNLVTSTPTGGFADYLAHHAYLAAAVPFVQQIARDQYNKWLPTLLPKAVSAAVSPAAVKQP